MRLQPQNSATRLAGLFLFLCTAVVATAQTSGFTYQGRLTDGGTAANANYDLQFRLFDAVDNGIQQPQPTPVTVTLTNVSVSGGIFTVQLDFGASAFPGANRFLEISARLTGAPSFTTLSPRQQITSTPYAIRSLNASSADAVTVSGVPGGSGNYIQNNPASQQSGASFNISGNGTAGGTLSANIVNATTQYNIGGDRLLSTGPPNLFNLFLGFRSGQNNTPGNPNPIFSGGGNSFFGTNAGAGNTSGFNNAFFGANAGGSNKGGTANSFFGTQTGNANDSGSDNSFFGSAAGGSNHFGSSDTLIGASAQVGLDNLTNATAVGARAEVDQSNALVLGSIAGLNQATTSVNVGIGTSTPQARLDVKGDTLVSGNVGIGTTTPASKLDIAATGDGAALLRLSTERPWVFRQVRTGSVAGLQLFSTVGQKAFEITASDGNNVATFLADSTASKVGIGTTSPAHRLSVIGGPSWTSSFWNGSMEFGNASAIGWQANTAGWHFGIGQTNGGLYFFQTSSDLGSTLSPVTYDLAITDGGLVGIGTTAPDNKLTVNGAADKPGGGSWGTFSDERLKNIKGRFTPGLKAVMQLKPLRYEYKPDNALGLKLEGEQVGFSAQAVQKVIPEAVTRNDKGYLLVNNDPIMWTMLNAIKEQQVQIETLRTQNAALSARLQGVEKALRKKPSSTQRRR